MFLRFLMVSAVLMAPADGGEPGGGAGGGGAGGDGGGDQPKYVTEERFNDLLNKAMGSRDKRFESKLSETLGGFGKTIEEKLAALAPKNSESDEPSKKKDPDLVRRDREFEELKKSLQTEKEARVAAETKQRTEKARGQLRDALGKHVRPEAVGVLLKAFSGDVQFDDQGEAVLPLPDGTGLSSIDAVIESWVKTPDANAFKPAPNSGGSGSQRSTGVQRVNMNGRKISSLSDAERDALLRGQ